MASRRFLRQVARARFIVLLPVALWSLSAGMVAADGSGLLVTVYDNFGQNSAPLMPTDDQIVGQTSMSQIDWSFDDSPLFGMTEDFVVRFDGFLIPPCGCEVRFTIHADDGIKLILDGEMVIDDWFDKGGGGSISAPVEMVEGEAKQITVWFYENGGGAWLQAFWEINGEWQVIPASAFMVTPPTTTTTSTSTTTTSTLVQTTTTSTTTSTTTTQPSTTVPPTTSAPESTTTTTTQPATTTSISPPTTTIPETTTSRPQVTATTTTSTTSTSLIETTTTTTTVPESTTSVSASTSTLAPPVDSTGRGMKPARLISRALRDGVSAGQQRAVVAGAVLIAMPSAFRPSRRP